MKKSLSKGTPEQLMRAVGRQIDELGGDVMESTELFASDDNRGYTLQQTESGTLVRDGNGNVVGEFPTDAEADEWIADQVEGCDAIEASYNGPWWYFTKHGVQPGSIPKGVNVEDVIDTPTGTYVALDRVLNTEELRQYELVEKAPEDIESATIHGREYGEGANISYRVYAQDDPDDDEFFFVEDAPDFSNEGEAIEFAKDYATSNNVPTHVVVVDWDTYDTNVIWESDPSDIESATNAGNIMSDCGSEYGDQIYDDDEVIEGECDCNCDEDILDEDFELIESADEVDTEDSIDVDDYLAELTQGLEEDVADEVESISTETDNVNYYVTVTYMDRVLEFEVPFDELEFNYDEIDQDISYIGNTIRQALDELE